MQTEDYELLYALEKSFWWFVGMREITAAVLDQFGQRAVQPKLILDAGCGTGENLTFLKRFAEQGRVIGVDLAKEAMAFSALKHPHSLIRATVTDLPFPDSMFDLVTSFDVLGQLPDAHSVEKALAEMQRVLRPGGITFIRVPAYQWMRSGHDRALGTTRRFDMTTLVNLVNLCGLRPVRTTYANTVLLPFAAVRRLLLKNIGLSDKGSDVKPLSPRLQWLNRLFTDMLHTEARWLKRPDARLRVGLSAICVAEKPYS